MASKLHRVVARNAATASENRIHDDAVARELGFSGGLVPGVTLYAYMTTPVVECFGRPWLDRGTISVRFERPVYDGQEVEVRAEPRTEGERGLAQLALELRNPDGVVCARGEASLPESSAALPDPADYKVREAPLPEARPPADDQSLAAGTVLSTQWATVRSERAAPFLSLLSDDLPVFVEERLAHPGFLILAANSALSSTVRLGPWIHTDSQVTNLAAVPDDAVVETRGVVGERFERRGHHFVRLDLVWLVDDQPVMRAQHGAIYRLRVAP